MNTSFWRRLNGVRLTYTTRWSVWLVALAVVFLLVTSWTIDDHGPARSMVSVRPQTTAGFGRQLDVADLSRVTPEQVLSLRVMPHQTLSAGQLKQLPNLRSLALYSISVPSIWDELAELSKLEALTIVGDLPTHATWPGFERLVQLKHVEWNASHSAKGLDQFSRLPKLETLDLTGAWPHRGMDWSVLRQFQKVRTLVLGMRPEWFKPAVVAELRAMPKLKRLYVSNSANPEDPFAGYDDLRRELSHIEFRPSDVNSNRVTPIYPAVFGVGVAMFLAVLLHWTAHFWSPMSRLVPGYVGPHLFVMTSIWLLTTGLACGAICRVGNPWWTSLSIALMPTAFPAMILLGMQNPQVKRSWLQKLMMVLTGVIVPLAFFIPVLIAINQSLFDWYLRGEMPVVTAILGIGSLAITLLAARRLVRLHSVVQEMGLEANPFQLDFNRMLAAKQTGVASGNESIVRRLQLGFSGRRIERRIRNRTATSWLFRATRWIRCNALSGEDIVLMAPPMFLIFILVAIVFGRFIGNQSITEALSGQFAFAPMLTGAMIGMAIPMVLNWYARQPLLGYESLRPVTRQQFVREIWMAIAIDMLPPMLLQMAIIGAVGLWTGSPISHIAAATIAASFPWLMMFGWILVVLTMHRTWRLFLVGIAAYVTTLAPMGLYMDCLNGGPLGMPQMYFAAAAAAVVVLLLAIARFRWQRVELGALP